MSLANQFSVKVFVIGALKKGTVSSRIRIAQDIGNMFCFGQHDLGVGHIRNDYDMVFWFTFS
jgi:hypothetical protein